MYDLNSVETSHHLLFEENRTGIKSIQHLYQTQRTHFADELFSQQNVITGPRKSGRSGLDIVTIQAYEYMTAVILIGLFCPVVG